MAECPASLCEPRVWKPQAEETESPRTARLLPPALSGDGQFSAGGGGTSCEDFTVCIQMQKHTGDLWPGQSTSGTLSQ